MKHVIRPAAKDDTIRQYRYYLLADAFETATRFLEAGNWERLCMMFQHKSGRFRCLATPHVVRPGPCDETP